MNYAKSLLLLLFVAIMVATFSFISKDDTIIGYITNPKSVQLYYKDAQSKRFGSLTNLKNDLEAHHKKMLFAMNGGMYKKDHSPQGLYIEMGKLLFPVDTLKGGGNFYLMPNGVFYLEGSTAKIVTTRQFHYAKSIDYATQSGPMLVINGTINPAFGKNSANLNVRNGVGILPDGRVLFAISKEPVNFYDLASYFKNAGCANALYLDGFVSRAYIPAENCLQTDGDFGVIIGITE